MKPMASKQLRLERTFDASPERLWEAWTDPKQYAKWLNPAGIDLVIHEWDLRVGGRVRFDMPQPSGDRNPQSGVFHVLDPPRRLVSGEPDKSFLLDVTFEPVGRRTRVVVVATGVPPEFHDAATQGWNVCFDRLEGLLRTGAGAADAKDREIVISREVNAAPARVWDALTKRDQVATWWGPNGFRNTIHEMDVRVGGLWRFTMHGPDGTDYPNWIRYEVVDPPRKLAYAHGGDDLAKQEFHATITLEDLGRGRTKVTLHSVFPSKEARDFVVREHRAIEGGKQTLARLDEFVGRH